MPGNGAKRINFTLFQKYVLKEIKPQALIKSKYINVPDILKQKQNSLLKHHFTHVNEKHFKQHQEIINNRLRRSLHL